MPQSLPIALLRLIITFVILISSGIWATPVASAQSIPVQRNQSTTIIYFAYTGALNSDLDIRNASFSLALTGSGFEIDTSTIQDIFAGNPYRFDEEEPPVPITSPSDCLDSSLPRYSINPALYNTETRSLQYGPQSEYGPTTGQTSSTLRAKSSGCIAVGIKSSVGALAGQQATLTFNENAGNSPDYQPGASPRTQTITFQLIDSATPTLTFGVPSIISGQIGTSFPSVGLTNSNLPTGFSAVFSPAGCTAPISGTVQNTSFAQSWVPANGSVIPQCALVGSQIGILSATNVSSINVFTNFSQAPTQNTPQTTNNITTTNPQPSSQNTPITEVLPRTGGRETALIVVMILSSIAGIYAAITKQRKFDNVDLILPDTKK